MQASPKQFALDISQTPQPSLRNFISPLTSDKGQFALLDGLHEIVERWQNQQAIPAALSWIYCWGPTGSGKSHLVNALLLAANTHRIPNLLLRPKDAHHWKILEDLMGQHEAIPLACFVEDIERLSENEQNLLFRLQIEARSNPNVFLFCTGAQSIAGLNLREDITSRLAWGLNFELTVLTDAQKIQAILQAAQERGISLSNEVPVWLLNNFHRDLPSLLGLIEALDHFSLEKKRAITLPLLREFLQSPSL